MEKVYVQTKNGLAINVDIQNAIDGFEYLGYEIKQYTKEDLYAGKYDHLFSKYVFVGSIDCMLWIFKKAGKNFIDLDYPKEMFQLISRKIVVKTKKEFIDQFKIDNEPKFIKPVQTKVFDGIIFGAIHQESYLHDVNDNELLYVSDLINILSEYRIYVHNGQMIYSANYAGDFWKTPSYALTQMYLSSWENKPVAFAIDVALLSNYKTEIIEISDFWAIGGYGLYSEDYAEMLRDRYWEIINDERK